MEKKNRLAEILSTKSPAYVNKVLELRELHACLMELPRNRILELQRESVYRNYTLGEGRIRTSEPQHYTDEHGIGKETEFIYINKVH